MEKNLGHATAYGYAKSKGYTGTEEEFGVLMASYASVAQDASQSASSAAESAQLASNEAQRASQSATSAHNDAETASNIKTDVESARDTTVSAKNATVEAKDISIEAKNSAISAKDTAESKAQIAEAWAVGQKDGTDVPSTDETYHNNAKYYSEQADIAKTDAESARDAAAQSSSEAAASATEAAQSAQSVDAEKLNRIAFGSYVVKESTGSIVRFEDGADNIPMKDVLVHVDPVQDLHGYDSLWPAGGGKNKLPSIAKITATQNGITFVCDGDGSCSFSGTATAQASFSYTVSAVTLPENVYVHTFNSNGYDTDIRPIIDFYYDDVRVDFVGFTFANRIYNGTSTMAGKTINKLQLRVPAGFSGTCAFKLYISETADIENFSPYSNICPITGWTGAQVTRTGKNLLDLSNLRKGNFEGSLNDTNVSFDEYQPIKGGQTYVWSSPLSTISGRYLRFYDMNKTELSSEKINFYGTGAKTFSAPSNARYFRGMWYVSTGVEPTDIVADQLELGSTATDYEPHSGQTYDITFPSEAGTVYGGTLDVTKGELVVDRAMVDLGTLTGWRRINNPASALSDTYLFVTNISDAKRAFNGLLSKYKWAGNYMYFTDDCSAGYIYTSSIAIRDDRYTDVESFQSAMSGVQLVYELATPQTYQLTPQEITSLLGENNVWADTGNSEVEYCVDPTLLLDNESSEIQSIKSMIAGVESSAVATKNYSIGDLVIVEDTLYEVTAAIASGETISVSKARVTTVDDVIRNRIAAVDNVIENRIADSIDDTLTQSGQAADAKKTGDEITGLKEDLSESVGDLKSAITDSLTFVAGENKCVFSEKLTKSGNTVYAPGLITTDYIAIPAGTKITFYQGVYTENLIVCAYNSGKTFVEWYSSASESRELTLPTNTVYVRMTYKLGYNGRIKNSTSYTLYYEAFSTLDGGIVSKIQDEIDNNKANLLGMIGEIFTPKFTAGKKLTRTGILVDDENYCISDVVDVSKVSSRIVFYSGTGLETLIIAIYNNQMELVEWYGISNTDHRELTKSDLKGGTLARFTFVPTYDARIVADGVILYEKLKNVHEPNNYYSAYIASKASRINTLLVDCAATGDAFVFVTDQHWKLNQKQSPALIYALNKRCHFAKVFCGGDTGDNPSEEYCNAMREYYPHKIYHVAGNHDWFSGSGDLIYYYMDAYNDEQIGNPQKHWYYVDNPQKKIRYIILNRFRYADETWINDYSTQEQVDWLQDDALDISAGWSVIVFTHWIRGSGASEGLNIRQILDTAKSNGKDIIAIICGHSHYDALWNTEGGIPIIVTTCDKNGPWISSGTDMEPWLTSQRSDGTVNEQAFDFCIIDRVNHKIDAVRIGAKAMKNYAEETSENFASTNLLEERIVHSEPVTVSTTATITKSISGTVTWETSDSTVATVSDGVVTKVSAGSCVVSATNEDGLYEAWIIIT